MDPVEVVRRTGGLSTRARVIAATSRAGVDRAVETGQLVRIGHGRLALPEVEGAPLIAHRLTGHLSLTSAALHHGWPVLHTPDRPHVTVRRHRRPSAAHLRLAHVHYADLEPQQIDGISTRPVTTLSQCLRRHPVPEALAVADSALREGIEPAVLHRLADSVRGPGAARLRLVVGAASRLKANPFESGLHGIALGVRGLEVRPQVVISEPGVWAQPDLVDRSRRIVLEADSFEWHGGRQALRKDARRYNLLVVNGWLVLRFAWEDVMFDPVFVHAILTAAVAGVQPAQLHLAPSRSA